MVPPRGAVFAYLYDDSPYHYPGDHLVMWRSWLAMRSELEGAPIDGARGLRCVIVHGTTWDNSIVVERGDVAEPWRICPQERWVILPSRWDATGQWVIDTTGAVADVTLRHQNIIARERVLVDVIYGDGDEGATCDLSEAVTATIRDHFGGDPNESLFTLTRDNAGDMWTVSDPDGYTAGLDGRDFGHVDEVLYDIDNNSPDWFFDIL